MEVVVSELLLVPKQGEKPPVTLRKGRKKRSRGWFASSVALGFERFIGVAVSR